MATKICIAIRQHLSRSMKKPTKSFAPSEDSDQPGHPPSLISLRCPCEAMGPWLTIEHQAKTDQTGWMPWLI